MQILIKNCQGKTSAYNISGTNTIKDLKSQITSKEGIPVEEQRLVFGGKQLDDGNTLDFYNIQKDSTVHLVLRLRGGF